MLNGQLRQPAIRLCCLTREDTIPGLVDEHICYDFLHVWATLGLIESLESLLYVYVAYLSGTR